MSATVDRVTEKSFKALVNFHPQIIFGNAGALQRLRAFGFESFSPFIDEAYDEERDVRRRYDLAYAEFSRLCRLTDHELALMEQDLEGLLTANARRGLVDLPREYTDRRDPALISELMALSVAQ